MQMAITFMAVVAGMIFSLAVALLAEELIFGQVFRLFFASGKLARQTVAVKSGTEALIRRNEKSQRRSDDAGVEVLADCRWPRDDSRGCEHFGL